MYLQIGVQNTFWNKTGSNHWQLKQLLQVGNKHLCKETAKLWPCGAQRLHLPSNMEFKNKS